MRETVTIQCGQAGNAIGNSFWSNLLLEHENTPDDDAALSAFFRFSENRSNGNKTMRARALLIDMECGPLNETMRSPLGSLFEETQYVMDVSGAGNNFAHGNAHYGPLYRERFAESLRNIVEKCDSLQTFILIHSLGGGTGSGVGTYMLGLIEDLYPDVYRFATSVYPQDDDDVVTSPYNSVLATRELAEHADCVFPLDNAALQSFVQMETPSSSSSFPASSHTTEQERTLNSGKGKDTVTVTEERGRGFNQMNSVAGRMLCHMTSSARFHGEMNVDMNELYTNLVPYPGVHFLMTALNPRRPANNNSSTSSNNNSYPSHSNSILARSRVKGVKGVAMSTLPKGYIQRAFGDIMSPVGQLSASTPLGLVQTSSSSSSPSTASPEKGYGRAASEPPVVLAAAFIGRGRIPLADFLSSVTNAQTQLPFPDWNPDACKIGLCHTPAPGDTVSVMGIYNSTAFKSVLGRQKTRFGKLYHRKAMLHHYTEFVDASVVAEAEARVDQVLSDYAALERGGVPVSRAGIGTGVGAGAGVVEWSPQHGAISIMDQFQLENLF